MKHGVIAVQFKCKVTDDGSDPRFVRVEHQTGNENDRPAKASITGEAGFKEGENISNKIYHNRMVNSYME